MHLDDWHVPDREYVERPFASGRSRWIEQLAEEDRIARYKERNLTEKEGNDEGEGKAEIHPK